MIPPDEARLQQLTDQAKRIWDEEEVVVVSNGLKGADPNSAYVRTKAGIVFTVTCSNGRALDAMEAAMLAIEDADSNLHTEHFKRAWVQGFESGIRVGQVQGHLDAPSISEPPYLGVALKDAMDRVREYEETLKQVLTAIQDATSLEALQAAAKHAGAKLA